MDIHSCHLLFDHFQFTLIHGPSIPGFYAILFFTASNFTSSPGTSTTKGHFCFGLVSSFYVELLLHSFPVVHETLTNMGGSSSAVIFLKSFHTIHGVLEARILKWFTIPFFSGPRFVRTLHHEPSILGGPARHVTERH